MGDGDGAVRIAHFTDLHVTERPGRIAWRDLASKRLLGWANLAFGGRYGVFRDAPRVAEAFTRDVTAVAPDHIVSTGDLSGLALASELESARRALGPLISDPRVTGIPGNHDVYVRAAVRDALYERTFGEWTRTDWGPAELDGDFRALHPYPLVRLLGEAAVLIALKDVFPTGLLDSGGGVGELQLRAFERLLGDSRLRDRVKVLALHTGLCGPDGGLDKWHHRLREAASLGDLARRAGVRLVIHGHIHRRFVIRGWQGSGTSVANPGSLGSSHGDRAYHVITIRGDRIDLEARRYDAASGAFVPWPDAPGAGRL